jgi:hypothetical protein
VTLPLRLFLIFLLTVVAGLSGCASLDRLPAVPLSMSTSIKPLNIPNARFYANGDAAAIEALALEMGTRERAALGLTGNDLPPNYFLAISGGGDDGAFGAGLMLGWTARGDRPSFRVVTGISTGALSAPFVFLGPEYDPQLKAVYTETSADDIFAKRPVIAAFANDAITDSTPLRNLIAKYLTAEMIARIGQEYDKGRVLLIATTNLDQGRSVIWNIGAIAKSTDPRARELIIEVLRASASIPGAFPPIMLDVTVDGKRYEEMHVDGGAVNQAFLYPPTFHLRRAALKRGIRRRNVAYVIRNGRLIREEAGVKRETLDIAGKAISTMISSAGVNDAYRIYLTTKRDGVEFNMAYIGEDFVLPYEGPFDTKYMRALFDYGFEKGQAGYKWHKTPPDYDE